MIQAINKVKFRLPDFHLPDTSPSDPAKIYNDENRFIKGIYAQRIRVCLSLIKRRYYRVLEIGIGSGVCIPFLLEMSDYVFGLDLHEKLKEVKETFAFRGYKRFDLVRADGYKMPFKDCSFDLIIGISVFEHLASNDIIASECKRVLVDDGDLLIGIPVENGITKLRYFYYRHKYSFPFDHVIHSANILDGLKLRFRLEEHRKLLPFAPFGLCLYYAARLKKR